jgi:hypothetical protein
MTTNTYDHDTLRIYAAKVHALEKIGTAIQNQMTAFRRGGIVPEAFETLDGALEIMHAEKRKHLRALQATVKGTALGEWIVTARGLGSKILVMLGKMPDLAKFSTPRKVWKYCGLHVVDGKTPKLKKGEQSQFSPQLRAYAIVHVAKPMMQANGAYRHVYDRRKEATEDRGWTNGHRHMDALRIMAKEIVRDAWRVRHGYEPLWGEVQWTTESHSTHQPTLVAA